MPNDKLLFLKDAFSANEIQVILQDEQAVVINPYQNENIHVSFFDDDDITPFVASFSYNHAHLTDEDSVIEWIEDIISGRKLAIEFFCNDKRCFGTDIEAEKLEGLSYQSLEQWSGYYGRCKLFDVTDSFKVRGWHPSGNMDAVFVLDDHNEAAIRITD